MNGDKCTSHDECFKRLYNKIENMADKLDSIADDLRERLHSGDVRFERLEMRLAQCEKALAERASGHSDVRQKIIGSIIDLIKLAVVGIGGAAAWAYANGYQG